MVSGSVWRIALIKTAVLTVLTALCAVAVSPVQAQANWPEKPIRLIVPFPPGGGTDILSRLVGNELAQSTKWTLVPDNRPGAGGTIGIAEAVRAAPTGYDLVMGQKDNLVVGPWLYKSVNYDPTRDLVAIAHVAYTPVVIVTRTESRFKSMKDVIAAARQAPDTITYGSPGNGTTIHLAAEILSKAADIELRHIPYKGSNAAMMDALSGNVDLLVASVPSALAQIKAGKLRALAVTSAKRSSSLPDVPAVAELGYKQVDVSTWYGLFAPAKTPAAIVTRVNAEVNKLLGTPAVAKAIQEQGAEPQAMKSEQFAAMVKKEYAQWKTIVQQSGAVVE
jgi:tripartite-type tricarboxylate transporter receptor subunit TctC